VLLIGADNGAHQFVPHHIAFRKIHSRNPGYRFQRLQCLHYTGALVRGEIDLRHISCDHAFGTRTNASQQHEHLLSRGILRLIENDKGVIQGTPTHVG